MVDRDSQGRPHSPSNTASHISPFWAMFAVSFAHCSCGGVEARPGCRRSSCRSRHRRCLAGPAGRRPRWSPAVHRTLPPATSIATRPKSTNHDHSYSTVPGSETKPGGHQDSLKEDAGMATAFGSRTRNAAALRSSTHGARITAPEIGDRSWPLTARILSDRLRKRCRRRHPQADSPNSRRLADRLRRRAASPGGYAGRPRDRDAVTEHRLGDRSPDPASGRARSRARSRPRRRR